MGNCLNVSRTTVPSEREVQHERLEEREVQHVPLSPSHPVYRDYVVPLQDFITNIDNIIGRMRALSNSESGAPPFDTQEFINIRRDLEQLRADSRNVRHRAQRITHQFISGERYAGDARRGVTLQIIHSMRDFHSQFVALGIRYNNEIIRVSGPEQQQLPDISSARQEYYRQDSNISDYGIPVDYLQGI